jgi:hypothetical protein
MKPDVVRRVAAAWFLITAIVGIAAMVTQLVMVIRGIDVLIEDGKIAPTGERVVRFFSYFTIQSNILVAIGVAILAFNPRRDGRIWRLVRLDGLFGITITGLIYATLLAPITDPHGIAKVTDISVHYFVPIAAVLGWLLFGPRPRIDRDTLLPSLIWPIAYMVYIGIYGAATHWYPYPFVDVDALGYLIVIRNGAGICLLLLGLAAVFMYVDGVLALGRDAADDDPRSQSSANAATMDT